MQASQFPDIELCHASQRAPSRTSVGVQDLRSGKHKNVPKWVYIQFGNLGEEGMKHNFPNR